MNQKKKLIIFCTSIIIAMIFWRLMVILRKGQPAILRTITGLSVHHFTYGIIIIFIASLILIFHKPEKYSIALMGLGFGSFFDSFISRLFSNTQRTTEIINYNKYLPFTIFLFAILILLAINSYLLFNRRALLKKSVLD